MEGNVVLNLQILFTILAIMKYEFTKYAKDLRHHRTTNVLYEPPRYEIKRVEKKETPLGLLSVEFGGKTHVYVFEIIDKDSIVEIVAEVNGKLKVFREEWAKCTKDGIRELALSDSMIYANCISNSVILEMDPKVLERTIKMVNPIWIEPEDWISIGEGIKDIMDECFDLLRRLKKESKGSKETSDKSNNNLRERLPGDDIALLEYTSLTVDKWRSVPMDIKAKMKRMWALMKTSNPPDTYLSLIKK